MSSRVTKKVLKSKIDLINNRTKAKVGDENYLELEIARWGGRDYLVSTHGGGHNISTRMTAGEMYQFLCGMLAVLMGDV